MTWFHGRSNRRRNSLLALGVAVTAGGAAIGSAPFGNGNVHGTLHGHIRKVGAELTSAELPAPLQTVYNQALADVPSQPDLYNTYQNDNIVVSVNGSDVTSQELSSEASELEQMAVASAIFNQYAQASNSISAPTASSIAQQIGSASSQVTFLDQAIAANVFVSLIYSYAQANGLAVSTATATQEAATNLQNWQASGSPSLPIPAGEPAGTTEQDLLDSPQAIATLQMAGSVANAEKAIAGAPDPTGTGTSRTPALAVWMTAALASANISATVNGVALTPSSLPGLLPARM